MRLRFEIKTAAHTFVHQVRGITLIDYNKSLVMKMLVIILYNRFEGEGSGGHGPMQGGQILFQ